MTYVDTSILIEELADCYELDSVHARDWLDGLLVEDVVLDEDFPI